MIFVALGTQDKPFNRLINEIDRLVHKNVIKEEVIVQAGSTKYSGVKLNVFSLLPMDEFNDYLNNANFIICHAGYGILSTSVSAGKKVIAVPRLKKYGEHTNDHQLQILHQYADAGYIKAVVDIAKLEEEINNINNFIPNEYYVNFLNLQKLIKNYIDNN